MTHQKQHHQREEVTISIAESNPILAKNKDKDSQQQQSRLHFLRETLLNPEEYNNNNDNNNDLSSSSSNDSSSTSNTKDKQELLRQTKIKNLPPPFQKKFLLPTSQSFLVVEPNFDDDYFSGLEEEEEKEHDGDDNYASGNPPSIIVKSVHPSVYFSSSSSSTTSTTMKDSDHHPQNDDHSETMSQTPSTVATYQQQQKNSNKYWTVKLHDVKINSVVGLTVVQFFDCSALLIALKKGMVLLHTTAKGKVLSRQHHHQNTNNESHHHDNVIPLCLPVFEPSSSSPPNQQQQQQQNQQITKVYPNGLLLAAGHVNPLSGFQRDFYVGFVSQALTISAALGPASRMMTSMTTSQHHTSSATTTMSSNNNNNSNLIRWFKLSQEQQSLGTMPLCVSRNFDSKVSISFEGAPFVYVWVNNGLSNNNNNNNNNNTSSISFPGIRSAFLTSQQKNPSLARRNHHHHQHSQDEQQQNELDFIKINCNFHAVTSMSWISNSTLVVGTNCGHVSVINLSSSSSTSQNTGTSTIIHTSSTSFDRATNSVRLPVRSSVAASVEYILSLSTCSIINNHSSAAAVSTFSTSTSTSSSSSSSTNHHHELILCATNRCDFFVVDVTALVVTHSMFSQSTFLRDLVCSDAFQQSIFDPEVPILFIAKEISTETSMREPGFTALGFIDQNYVDGRKMSPKKLALKASATFDLERKCFPFQEERRNSSSLSMRRNLKKGGASSSYYVDPFSLLLSSFLHRRETGSFGFMTNEENRQNLIDRWISSSSSVTSSTTTSLQQVPSASSQQSITNASFFSTTARKIMFTDKNGHVYYLLDPPVGSGAFGEVWFASSVTTRKFFAIKRLIGDSSSTTSRGNNLGGGENAAAAHTLANEEQLFNSLLPHPNLLQAVLSSSSSSSSVPEDTTNHHLQHRTADLGLVLSFAFGTSLESKLLEYCHQHQEHDNPTNDNHDVDDNLNLVSSHTTHHPLAVLSWFLQLLSGLAHLHSCGITHRDVKPANILDRGHCKENCHVFCWSDFGVSRLMNTLVQNNTNNDNNANNNNNFLTAKTKMATNVGTPAYQCPEILSSFGLGSSAAPTSTAGDVWSLAACFYCLLMQKPDGVVSSIQEIPAVLEGRLPTLVEERRKRMKMPHVNNEKHDLLLSLPGSFLELLDCMMNCERKMRPTVAQSLSAFTLTHDEHANNDDSTQNNSSSFSYGLGSNSVLTANSPNQKLKNYALYSFSPSCLLSSSSSSSSSSILLSDDANDEFSKVQILSRQYMEFWPLPALEPQLQYNRNQHTNITRSSLLVTSPKIICDKLLIQVPHRSLGEAIRAGVASSNAAASFYFEKHQFGMENCDSIVATRLPPRYILDHVCLAPLLSVSCDYVPAAHHQSRITAEGEEREGTTSSATAFYERHYSPQQDLSICVEYALQLPPHDQQQQRHSSTSNSSHRQPQQNLSSSSSSLEAHDEEPIRTICTAAEWLDQSRDLRDCTHRFNKLFHNVLKFIAYSCTEASLSSLPSVSYDFTDLFIHIESEKVIIGRSTNLLTIALLLDAAEEHEDHVCSKLLENVLEDPEIRRHAGLMHRSTLDVVMMVTDNFAAVYEKKICQVHCAGSSSSSSNSATTTAMNVLCKSTEFVGLYIQHLQKRKKKLFKNLGLVQSSSEYYKKMTTQKDCHYDDLFTQPDELVEPDFLLTPEFTNFFPVV